MRFLVRRFQRIDDENLWMPIGLCNVKFDGKVTILSHIDHIFNHRLDTFDILIMNDYIEIRSTLKIDDHKHELFTIRMEPHCE